MDKKILLLLTLLFYTSVGFSQKYVNEFLSIGVGARSLGMSNSQTAVTSDANSIYWNPAGILNQASDYSVSLMHAAYFNGTANFDFAGVSHRLDSVSGFGIGIIRFGIDDIPDTRFLFDADGTLNYQNIRSFSAADYALIASYARKLPLLNGVKLGGSAKIIHRSVGEFANAWGFGIDLGAQATIGSWQLGVVARDITGTYIAWNFNSETFSTVFLQTGNTLPENRIETATPRLIFDAARKFPLIKKRNTDGKEIPKASLLISGGVEATFDGERNTLIKSEAVSVDPRVGIEGDYQEMLYLRFGVGNIQKLKDFDGSFSTSIRPTFGVGFRVKSWFIDYALTDIGNVDNIESNYSHVFSVKFSINNNRYKTPRHDAM